MSDDILLALGEIKGELKGVNRRLARQENMIDSINENVVDLKTKAAKTGTIAGMCSALGMALAIEVSKHSVGR